MGDGLNVVTYLTSHTLELIRPAMGEHPDYVQLASGVDVERFSPEVDGTAVRLQHGLLDRQVILCVSRLVPRKGQDILIQALPLVRRSCPDASLLLVGEGPYGSRLRQMAEESPDSKHITFAGAVESADLPSYYAAADVFAMPCRDRQGGREIEGLGIVFLEASASGLPVIAGKSGGSVDAVSDGTTGRLVDGSSVEAVSEALIELCNNPEQARDLGRSGRAWVEKSWTWEAAAGRLAAALQLSA
jgi:phosphatidylinositol alpha-1,6-mannosyltransferase